MKIKLLFGAVILFMMACTSTPSDTTTATNDKEGEPKEEEMANSEFKNPTIQIGVVVSDLERSLDFYTNVLGMKRTGEFDVSGEFGKLSGLTDGEAFSVAVLKLDDSAAANQWKLMSFGKSDAKKSTYIHDDIGMQYTTIFVKSMKPFLERLEKNNIPLLGDTPTKQGDGQVFVLIQDPDGIFIELIGGE